MKSTIANKNYIYTPPLLLFGIVVFSIVSRLILALQGDQLFWADEKEYFRFSASLYKHLLRGDLNGFFNTPVIAHWGGVMCGIFPFFIKNSGLDPKIISGVFYAIPGVVNTILLYYLSLAMGSGKKSALISAAIFSIALSNVYMARHILPYDLSMMFFLAALMVSLKAGAQSRFFLAGFLCFAGFISYYGHWTLAVIVLCISIFYRISKPVELFSRAFGLSAGFFLPFALFLGAGFYYHNNLLAGFLNLSGSVTQGDFSDGYKTPFLFFYYSEGLLAFIWMACLITALKYHREPPVKLLLCAIFSIYVLFIIQSNLLEMFVIYGRTARQITPFLCLIAGVMLAKLPTRWLLSLFVLLGAAFLLNFYQAVRLVHLDDFMRVAAPVMEEQKQRREMHWQNIADDSLEIESVPTGCTVLISMPHPVNARFLQYDGLNSRQRTLVREQGKYMRLIDCGVKASSP